VQVVVPLYVCHRGDVSVLREAALVLPIHLPRAQGDGIVLAVFAVVLLARTNVVLRRRRREEEGVR
jgi:hypothetical protein